MTICPECQHENSTDSLLCGNCGGVLLPAADVVSIGFSSEDIGGIPTESLDPAQLNTKQGQDRLIGFRHSDSGKFFSFPSAGNFTVGRVSEGQSILPDVDFSTIQGFEAGVSRLHAVINISAKGFSLTDLGSSNGSSVNGHKIEQHVERKIENGDKIQFGRLTLEAIIRM